MIMFGPRRLGFGWLNGWFRSSRRSSLPLQWAQTSWPYNTSCPNTCNVSCDTNTFSPFSLFRCISVCFGVFFYNSCSDVEPGCSFFWLWSLHPHIHSESAIFLYFPVSSRPPLHTHTLAHTPTVALMHHFFPNAEQGWRRAQDGRLLLSLTHRFEGSDKVLEVTLVLW